MLFEDRHDAGRRLAAAVTDLKGADVVVLGLPRGGVPVGYEVAQALGAPLDVIVVRKLGTPGQPELAMGAIGEGGVRVLNQRVIAAVGATEDDLAAVERQERQELERRARQFRGDRPPVPLAGRVVLIVDDGIATGSTARAACQVARAHGASRVVLAAPVGPPGVEEQLRPDADEVRCLAMPEHFFAIGQFYADFAPTADAEVTGLLARLEDADEEVAIPVGRHRLAGRLTVPVDAHGVVVFAHGSGSSRYSPRNRRVATSLNVAGLGTLLFDLLTPEEEADRANVFAIELLAGRLAEVTRWLPSHPAAAGLAVGYFGASTGAAAALWAAAEPDSPVAAVVSRGGRPDLAAPRLGDVRAPTLLIVGGADDVVLDLNRAAQQQLRCPSRLEVVPRATHLFEEPGALDEVARLAAGWFADHLG